MAQKSAAPARLRWLGPTLIVLFALAAYCNSFRGPFVYDDIDAILLNARVQSLFPGSHVPAPPSSAGGRPLLRFSLAVDYAISGFHVWSYHATNLLIHLACALLLYAIVRAAISNPVRPIASAGAAQGLAAVVAILWTVHPLQTEAVTYVIQRAESLASMFFLLAIWALIRASRSRVLLWGIAAIAACFASAATKEMAATIPLIALLYDRTFLAGSFGLAIRRRWGIYLGMLASWILLAALIAYGGRSSSVSFHEGLSAFQYARTQLNVIAHYLRLAIWPAGQVFDYGDWPIAWRWSQVDAGGYFVLALVLATLGALWRAPVLGFAGAWFFLILAPSSSFVPILTEIAAEHRMYLPLASPIALLVVGVWRLTRNILPSAAQLGAAGAVAIALLGVTLLRNEDYSSAIRLWQDTVNKEPTSERAHFNLGFSLASAGQRLPRYSSAAIALARRAAEQYRIALRLKPDYWAADHQLGHALTDADDLPGVEQLYQRLLKLSPSWSPEAHFMLGTLHAHRAQWPAARADFQIVAEQWPNDPQGHYELGVVLQELGDLAAAEHEYERTLQLAPQFQDARLRLVQVRAAQGELQ